MNGFVICDGDKPVNMELSDDVAGCVDYTPELGFVVFPTADAATDVMNGLPGSSYHEGETGLVLRAVTITLGEIVAEQEPDTDEDDDEDEADEEDFEAALAAFGEQCTAFAKELNDEQAMPGEPDDGEERGEFYWSQQDMAWQHQGVSGWEFLGSVAWQDGQWVADWQEHK